MDRTDAFEVALRALREQLRDGAFPAGTRIPAAKVAADLGLSATPVREALARLAGEGLVEERRQQGFFVRTLTGIDIADLYRLSLSHLAIAHGQRRTAGGPSPGAPLLGEPIRATEILFERWMTELASGSLLGFYRTLAIQLGPVRRAEPLVLPGLEAEAIEIAALDVIDDLAQRIPALRRFHARRIAAADRLASLFHRPELRGKI